MKYLVGLRLWLLCVVVLLGAAGRVAAQAPAWDWAVTPGFGFGRSSAVDAAGNVYVTGYFLGTATFGTTTLTSTGASDGFVAKLTRSGTYQWVAQIAGMGDETGNAIAVDAAGNVYVTGGFTSLLAAFGPAISLTKSGNGNGSSDAFVTKLSAAGVWQWAVKGGGTGGDFSNSLALDGSGNAYVTGTFDSSTATFAPAVANPITLTYSTAGGFGSNTFVAKLSAAGIYQWANSATGFSNGGHSVVVDGNGQAYISGYYNDSPATFGPIVLPRPVLPPGVTDLFVARLTAAGAWDWAIGAGSSSGIPYGALALDGSGNLMITGGFFGQLTLGTTTLTSAGSYDVFAAQLNPAGTGAGAWTWAVRAGGLGYDSGRGLALDGSGNAYVTGEFFSSAASFGPTTLASAGSFDVFVAKLTPTGTWQWATQAGGTTDDRSIGAAVASNGAVCVTGWFQSNPASFGSILLPNINPRSIFLAHLGANGVGLPEDTTPAFTLAPNPAHHTAILTGAPGITATLLDGLGRVVRTVPLRAGAATLDVRGLASGLYVVRCGGTARRLVVE